MKVAIRKSTFETNSSSVHTLSIAVGGKPVYELNRKKFRDCYMRLNNDDTLTLCVPCGDYTCGGSVSTIEDKLSYLCTYITLDIIGVCWADKEDDYEYTDSDDPRLRNILEAVQMAEPTVSSLMVVKTNRAYFDHQTAPCEEECVVDLYDPKAIAEFLFNEWAIIYMGRD